MARLWDQNIADRAAAIDQALKLGGRVVEPPRATGFGERHRAEPAPAGDRPAGFPDGLEVDTHR